MLLKLNKEGPFKKDVFRAPGHQVCSLSLKIGQKSENPIKNTWKPKTPLKTLESIGKLVYPLDTNACCHLNWSDDWRPVMNHVWTMDIRQRVSSVVTNILNLLIMNHV
jgi:hypothetical protein